MILNGCYVSVGLFCTICSDVYSKMFIFKKLSDMIINASEWFENIFGGRSLIFTALLDGLVPKIDLPTLVK